MRAPAAALLLTAACACVVTAAGCTTGVLHSLEEPAANEALAALERAGIAADKVADDRAQGTAFSLRVARGDAARALDVLRVQGLPRGRRHGFAELYGQPSLIPTASEERARYVEALAGEIERTLETAEGIVSARVHLVLAEADPQAIDPQAKPRSPARAAVLLKTAAGRTPLPQGDVQKLVAGSVPDLDPAAVSVVVTAAPRATEPGLGPLATVGPIRVTASSRPLLVAVLAVALALIAALATTLLFALRRRAAK